MRVIGVPYHLDEYLTGVAFPLRPAEVVTADLPVGEVWEWSPRCTPGSG